jgi:hypothetical protein
MMTLHHRRRSPRRGGGRSGVGATGRTRGTALTEAKRGPASGAFRFLSDAARGPPLVTRPSTGRHTLPLLRSQSRGAASPVPTDPNRRCSFRLVASVSQLDREATGMDEREESDPQARTRPLLLAIARRPRVVRCDTLVRIAGGACFPSRATSCSAWTDLIAGSVLRRDGLTPVSLRERLAFLPRRR